MELPHFQMHAIERKTLRIHLQQKTLIFPTRVEWGFHPENPTAPPAGLSNYRALTTEN